MQVEDLTSIAVLLVHGVPPLGNSTIYDVSCAKELGVVSAMGDPERRGQVTELNHILELQVEIRSGEGEG
ncbi:hypothetical protein ACLOJK_038113 [Asimina triloba]